MQVTIVHDIFGRIVSINRPTNPNAIVMTKDGQSSFVTEVDEKSVGSLINSHRVDVARKSLVPLHAR